MAENLVGIVTRLWAGRPGKCGLIFLLSKISRPTPFEEVQGALY